MTKELWSYFLLVVISQAVDLTYHRWSDLSCALCSSFVSCAQPSVLLEVIVVLCLSVR